MTSHETARERIVEAARRLFRLHGFQAVGVDEIVREADVAKMTLYRHFGSKEDLVVVVLRREDAELREWLRRTVEGAEGPEEAIAALFDALDARTAEVSCSGCLFQMALGEYAEPDHAVHVEAARHKKAMRQHLLSRVCETDLNDPDETAERLFMLMEGAWAVCRGGARRRAGLAEAATLLLAGERYVQSLADASSTKKD